STNTNTTINPIIYLNPYSTISFNLNQDFPLPFTLFYAPDNSSFINYFISSTFTGQNTNSTVTIHKYSDETKLNQAMIDAIKADSLSFANGIGVYFDDIEASKSGNLNYTLKIPGSELVSTILKGSCNKHSKKSIYACMKNCSDIYTV